MNRKFILCLYVVFVVFTAKAQQSTLRAPIGDPLFKDWKNISKLNEGIATISFHQQISYRYPDGKRIHKGFRVINQGASDWSKYYGIRFDIFLEKELPVDFDVCFKVSDSDTANFQAETHANISITGLGWHEVILPWNRFEIKEAQILGILQCVKELQIQASSNVSQGRFRIKNIELTQGNILALKSQIKGRSAPGDSSVTYQVEVGNVSNTVQSVNLKIDSRGWESMKAIISPSVFELKPGETRLCTLLVHISNRIPAGNTEKQILNAIPNGNNEGGASLTFITASALPYPNILFTSHGWQDVKNKVKKYDWAKKGLADYEKLAMAWIVPEVATKLTDDNPDKGMQLFQTQQEFNLMACGISYQLTGKKEYAEKIALFMRRLSDPATGYPTTFRGCHQSFVQEGHFFQHIAMAYDMVVPANVFSNTDKAQIERTFRLFFETVDLAMHDGGINNWKLSEMTGALYCALAVQDWDLAERMFSGACGIMDHLSNGVMNDGWWYECSIGYNVWCSSEFSQIAMALEPWGINFKDMKIPIGTTAYYSLMPAFMKPGMFGMNFDKWGPISRNSICIKDMWDALPAFTDYRGVMFGVNDAQETLVSGQPYELAYYMYRDPEYAAIIRRGNSRDLLYGVPELPDTGSSLIKKSAYADNLGVAMLRSNTVDRPQREQIQTALHYGTHGGFHGHFDRTGLLNLSRYGRSFYNPEMIWFGYASYLYKFLIQSSMTKNMVVVDQKMQEPAECKRNMFFSGKMIQATEIETKARWSNPPYGGMIYDYLGGISFAKKSWMEGHSLVIPQNAPTYGSMTGYTEPVLQRRLMVVTDDYVILADYLDAASTHTYDWLLQMKGFKGLTATKKEFLKHDAQMTTDPLSSGQFITDCNWFRTSGITRSSFQMCWGKGCDNAGTLAPYSDEGPLKMDVFSVWPLQNEIMTATAPENFDLDKQLWYTVEADGQVLVNDSTGAWILGNQQLNIDISGKKKLLLKTKVNKTDKPNIFWAGAIVLLKNGTIKHLSDLNPVYSNILLPDNAGHDFQGGSVKIGGAEYENNLSGMPSKKNEYGTITIDLKGLDVEKFSANIGADFPLGNESQRRRTFAVRTRGTQTRYITVLEPFEDVSAIKNIVVMDENKFQVELADGRIQEITLKNLQHTDGQSEVAIREFKNGLLLREEKTN